MKAEILTPTKRQITDWSRLTQKKFRREWGYFLIEGEVCVREALQAKIELQSVLSITEEAEAWLQKLKSPARVPFYALNSDSFARISKVETSQGVAAVAQCFQLPERSGHLTIGCEQVSDPGNCGALIRVADFFGAAELQLGENSAEIWNSKVVRGSMGSIFHQPVREDVDLDQTLHSWKGTSVALVAHEGKLLSSSPKLKPPVLLVLGHETRGLSESLLKLCSHPMTLERKGSAESLNLVTAAAVAAFVLTT
jgi:RNA methyltransferase, TrmH family